MDDKEKKPFDIKNLSKEEMANLLNQADNVIKDLRNTISKMDVANVFKELDIRLNILDRCSHFENDFIKKNAKRIQELMEIDNNDEA